MSYTSLLIHSVTVKQRVPGATDRYGNETNAYDAGTVYPARVQQLDVGGQGRELLVGRDTRQTWFEVFLPPNANLDALSLIDWNGKSLQADGEPSVVYDSTGPHHIQAVCRQVEG